jgi:hypothetical protein
MIQVYLYLVLIFIIVVMLNIYYHQLLEMKRKKIAEYKKKIQDAKNRTTPCFLNECDESYRFCRSSNQYHPPEN